MLTLQLSPKDVEAFRGVAAHVVRSAEKRNSEQRQLTEVAASLGKLVLGDEFEGDSDTQEILERLRAADNEMAAEIEQQIEPFRRVLELLDTSTPVTTEQSAEVPA